MECFYTFKETSQMDNVTNLQTFQSHVEAINHLNGNLGFHMYYIKAQIQEAGSDLNDVAACERTKDEIHEEFVVKFFCSSLI
jgi:hypothetical protein